MDGVHIDLPTDVVTTMLENGALLANYVGGGRRSRRGGRERGPEKGEEEAEEATGKCQEEPVTYRSARPSVFVLWRLPPKLR